MEHHNLDPYPFPKEKAPLFINEPVLVDQSLAEISDDAVSPKNQPENGKA